MSVVNLEAPFTKKATVVPAKQYDALIYIGRFQPFHNAHLATVEYAATLAKRVIVVIGSANQPRDEDNPFFQQEREDTIQEATSHIVRSGVDVICVNVENSVYNNMEWALNVADKVNPYLDGSKNVRIIGHTKDESSFYLKLFPQWGEPIEMPLVEILDATTIRQMYFSEKFNPHFFEHVVPPATLDFLNRFNQTGDYQYIMEEADYIRKYRKPYQALPYEPTFNTGDAVVFKSGHVLVVRRRSAPGKGLLAFPGGFLNAKRKGDMPADASLRDCAIRELYEETKIKVPEKVIRGNIREEKIFDAVNRSRRGRIITTAQFIILPDDVAGLPKVKGSDDAEKAFWLPINEARRIDFFEDHYDILRYFVGRAGQ